MDHTEYIVEIKKVIKPELIKKIIPFIDNRANKNLTVEEGVNTNIRNVKGHTLKSNNKTDIFYFNLIKLEIERLYMFYKVKFPFVDAALTIIFFSCPYSKKYQKAVTKSFYSAKPVHQKNTKLSPV